MIKVGDTVSRSAFFNDDKEETVEYGVVVCIFKDKYGYDDAYIAFTGDLKPKNICVQPDKPYILRYHVETLKKVEI